MTFEQLKAIAYESELCGGCSRQSFGSSKTMRQGPVCVYSSRCNGMTKRRMLENEAKELAKTR